MVVHSKHVIPSMSRKDREELRIKNRASGVAAKSRRTSQRAKNSKKTYCLFQQGGELGVPEYLKQLARELDPNGTNTFSQNLRIAKEYIEDQMLEKQAAAES